jgi:glycosyltransferase involved in cell wall biosynthesis
MVTAVIAVFGNQAAIYPEVDRLASAIAENYSGQSSGVELILVPHGDPWRLALPFGSLSAYRVRIASPAGVPELPALLFNHGAREARGSFLAFAWPGIDFASWLIWLQRWRHEAPSSSRPGFVAARPSPHNVRKHPLQSWKWSASETAPSAYDGGWVEMFDYVPMAGSVISREYFFRKGGFSPSPLLQRAFWWEFTARATRTDSIAMLNSDPPACRWSAADFPLANDLGLSGDLVARRVVRRSGSPRELHDSCDWAEAATFAADLSPGARQALQGLLRRWGADGGDARAEAAESARDSSGSTGSGPLRIVVLGGMNEPAHNQLCFFNYFELLEGHGVLTWRVILDTAAQPLDVMKADLVIFSRTRSDNACRLMDCCKRFGIPAVYMLDDNWFAIGKEWKEYADVFTPKAKTYEDFLYCLTRADYVLTYNPILAEDLRPYSRNLEVLPVNVKLSLFPRAKRRPDRRLRVGYVGSPRRMEAPFEALASLAKKRDDFDVFVMGLTLPNALASLPAERLIHCKYVFGYSRYAVALCEAMPDVLLAPVENTRSDASRCPNKYLEITASGAVGVYSNLAPYVGYVKDRENGLLAESDSESWNAAIAFLLDNPDCRAAIIENAQSDVRARFDTPVVLPRFLDFLMRASGTLHLQKAAAR